MNSFALAIFSLCVIASICDASSRQQWSGDIKMQIARDDGPPAGEDCSDQTMQALNENIGDFLHNELWTLLESEDAFALGVVQSTEENGTLSLTAKFDCLDCDNEHDKTALSRILMFFIKHHLSSLEVTTDICVSQKSTLSSVSVIDKSTRPVAIVDASPLAAKFNASKLVDQRKSKSECNATSSIVPQLDFSSS